MTTSKARELCRNGSAPSASNQLDSRDPLRAATASSVTEKALLCGPPPLSRTAGTRQLSQLPSSSQLSQLPSSSPARGSRSSSGTARLSNPTTVARIRRLVERPFRQPADTQPAMPPSAARKHMSSSTSQAGRRVGELDFARVPTDARALPFSRAARQCLPVPRASKTSGAPRATRHRAEADRRRAHRRRGSPEGQSFALNRSKPPSRMH